MLVVTVLIIEIRPVTLTFLLAPMINLAFLPDTQILSTRTILLTQMTVLPTFQLLILQQTAFRQQPQQRMLTSTTIHHNQQLHICLTYRIPLTTVAISITGLEALPHGGTGPAVWRQILSQVLTT